MTQRSEPAFFVLATPEGGTATRLDLTDQVLDFSYEDTEDKADKLQLKVRNWDLSNFDEPVWKQGTKLTVAWGYPGNMSEPREVTIKKVTGSVELSVEALGAEANLNAQTKTRSFENMTRAEVVAQIAKEHGLAAPDIEDTGERVEVITQARMTDAQMLRRLAEIEGFEFFADVDGLHFHQRRLGQKPTRVFQWYLPPDVGDIIKFNVTNDVFAKPEQKAGKVTAQARTPDTKEDVEETGSDATTVRDKVAPVALIVDPVTGAISQTTEAPSPGPRASSSDVRPTTAATRTAVKREVDGAFKKMQLQAAELDLEVVGDPQLRAKTIIEVRGISKLLSGLYYIKAITSKLSSSGFTQSLKCAADGTQGHQGKGGGGVGGGGVSASTVAACQAKLQQKIDRLQSIVAAAAADPTGPLGVEAKQLEAEVSMLQKKCAALAAAQSKGKVNEKKADDTKDAGKLEEVVTVDPVTGEKTISYQRSSGGKATK